ncbi:hypothetical protein F8S13_03620 [Chloroflexia bacterium SDU3-3]|nr:hypothetical protein F8S13_03620 [Chloroflexia bacterium SDU3-3]
MEHRLSTTLDQALALMQAGASVEECLARYPADQAALEPLLWVAAAMATQAAEPLGADLELWPYLEGAHELAAIAALRRHTHRRSQRPTSPAALDTALDLAQLGGPPLPCLGELAPLADLGSALYAESREPLPREMIEWLAAGERDIRQHAERRAGLPLVLRERRARRGLAQAALATLAAAFMLLAVDQASAESLPGQPLYAWKLAREDLAVAITPDAGPRGWLHVRYAQERMSEAQALISSGVAADSPLVAGAMHSALEHSRSALSNATLANTYPNVLPALSQMASESRATLAQVEQAEQPGPALAEVRQVLDEIAGPSVLPAVASSTVSPQPTATLAVATPVRTSAPASPTAASAVPTAAATRPPTAAPTPALSATVVAATATATPIATAAAQPTLPPSATPVLPSATPQATASATPQATATVTATATAMPSATVMPSATPTATATPTALPTATPTATPSATPTVPPSETPAPSETPVPPTELPPSETPAPSETPVPPTELPPSETPVPSEISVPSEIVTAEPQE